MKGLLHRALVPEINAVNLMLFWLFSFVMKIEAYGIHRTCPRLISRGIALLDLDTYVSWSEARRFISDAVRRWERFFDKFRENRRTLRFGGYELDFSTKAKQGLASHFAGTRESCIHLQISSIFQSLEGKSVYKISGIRKSRENYCRKKLTLVYYFLVILAGNTALDF